MPRLNRIFCLLLSFAILCVSSMAQRIQPLLNSAANVSSGRSEHKEDDPKQTPAPDQTTEGLNPEAWLSGQGDAGWTVIMLKNSAYVLKAESIQLADSKTSSKGVSEFARNHVLSTMLQSSVRSYSFNLMMHDSSFLNQTLVGSASDNASDLIGMFSRPKLHTTYVWALRRSSASVIVPDDPTFEVHYDEMPGVNPNDFQPVILKLTVTANNWRLVGETLAKGNASGRPSEAALSSFVEKRVGAQVTVLGKGVARIKAPKLAAGEYAVVLRPVSDHMKIAAADVGSDHGNWLALSRVWAFEVQ